MNDGTRTFDAEGLPNIRVGPNARNEFDVNGRPVVQPEIRDVRELNIRERLNFHPVSIQLTVPPVDMPADAYRAMLDAAREQMHPEQYRRLTIGEFVPQRPCHKDCAYHGDKVYHVIQCPNAER